MEERMKPGSVRGRATRPGFLLCNDWWWLRLAVFYRLEVLL